MYGQDFTPNIYGLIDTCADHLHWVEQQLGILTHRRGQP